VPQNRLHFWLQVKNKAAKTEEILGVKTQANEYPASHIWSENGMTEWALDEEAAKLL